MATKLSLDQRLDTFWKKVEKTDSCWEWKAALNQKGYGIFWNGDKLVKAHRFSYEITNDFQIPTDLTIDHLCRNKKCVNPKHLEVVTLTENIFRGDSIVTQNMKKTHCINGHPLTPDNVYIYRGWRICKQCRAYQDKKYRESKK